MPGGVVFLCPDKKRGRVKITIPAIWMKLLYIAAGGLVHRPHSYLGFFAFSGLQRVRFTLQNSEGLIL